MRSRFITVVIAGLLIVGFSSATHHGAVSHEAAPNPVEASDATLLFPKTEADGMLWPLNRSRVWKINRLDPTADGDLITLEIRTTHESAEFSPTFPIKITREKSEKTRVLESSRRVPFRFEPAKVGIQIIDLDDIAVSNGKPRCRLLVTLNIGAGTTYIKGEDGIIKGKIEATSSQDSAAEWKKGEMHLYGLIVNEDDKKKERLIYSFVLVQTTYPPKRK